MGAVLRTKQRRCNVALISGASTRCRDGGTSQGTAEADCGRGRRRVRETKIAIISLGALLGTLLRTVLHAFTVLIPRQNNDR